MCPPVFQYSVYSPSFALKIFSNLCTFILNLLCVSCMHNCGLTFYPNRYAIAYVCNGTRERGCLVHPGLGCLLWLYLGNESYRSMTLTVRCLWLSTGGGVLCILTFVAPEDTLCADHLHNRPRSSLRQSLRHWESPLSRSGNWLPEHSVSIACLYCTSSALSV